MGHVERVQAWKNWGVPNGAIPHIETLAEYWKSQGSKAEAEGPVKTLTEAMVRTISIPSNGGSCAKAKKTYALH